MAIEYLDPNQFTYPFISSQEGYIIQKPGLDNFFKRTQLPFIGEFDTSKYITDEDLKMLEDAMIKDTYVHRHQCYWKDNNSQSFGYLTVSVIQGEGVRVKHQDQKIVEVIENWNDEVNAKHQSIEDVLKSAWIDNLLDRRSIWRVFKNEDDPEHLIDIQRIPLYNIKEEVHPTMGWKRIVQGAYIPKRALTKNTFYRGSSIASNDVEYVETIIPDEPETCLYFSFFDVPPTSSVLHLMMYKRWIIWFMRKFAEKYWAPFLIGYVGDPKNGIMPTSLKDQQDSLHYTAEALKRVRNYGVASFLATTKIEALDVKAGKSSDIYVNYLEYLNKEIILGLLGSMGLRQDAASGKATTDIVQQGYLRFIRGIRESYAIKLRKFYAKVLLPAYGYEGIDARDIKIDWPPLRLDNIKDLLSAVEIAAKIGAFTDVREIRKILNPVWRHIDDDITEEQAKQMKNLFMEINSPSRAEGDKPQTRASSTSASSKK